MSEGELIIGNCKLTTCLATGNQTQVWEAIEQGTNEKYAMKLLLPEAFKDPAQKQALKHEANVLKSFEHPNIVKFKSLVFDKKNGFMLMELFRAPNLKSQAQTDLLSVHLRLKRLIEQVSQAMAHIHDKGWLHRDLKPDNILFSKAAELRVIDFSLSAKIATGMAAFFHKKKKIIQGTRTYMAPEQIRGMKLGPYTDIYNFGVTLFELLTGRTPYAGFTPNDLLKRHLTEAVPAPSVYNSNVTPEADRVIMKMMAKKPDQRQKSFNELLAEMRNVSLFKEPPEKLIEEREANKENEGVEDPSLSDRRDSRSDARRAEQSKSNVPEESPNPKQPPIRVPGTPPNAGSPPPGVAPPGMAPPGMVPPVVQPPRPASVPPGVAAGRPPQAIPVGGPQPRPGMLPAPPPPGARPPGMPPPPGVRPPGPPGVAPPGMPPRPGAPAVAAVAGGPPGGPPRPAPPGIPPQAPRPGGPPAMAPPGQSRPPMPGMPPGQPPRPAAPLPPGVRPPGPPAGGPPRPAPPQPRPAPPAKPPSSADEASLDDFKID